MDIMILSESVPGLGLGHVARCLNIALRFINVGYEVRFFIRGGGDFKDFILAQTLDSSITNRLHILALQWEDITDRRMLACDICVIDSYHISDMAIYIGCAKVALIFDDDGRHIGLLDKEGAGNVFLLNQNGFYNSLDIAKNLQEKIFCGIEYAFINNAFFIESSAKKEYDYFVCLGGEDLLDKSYEVFTSLSNTSVRVAIIIGANYKGKLAHLTSPNIDIFKNISQEYLARLIALSKACIVSGGGIVFEALRLCNNVFVLNLASNQDIQISMLLSNSLIKEISLPLDSTLNIIDNDTPPIASVGSQCANMINRLLLESLNANIADSKEHKDYHIGHIFMRNFCNLDMASITRVLAYRNHEYVREHMYGNNTIDLQSHLTFIQSLHNEENSRYFLVQSDRDIDSTNMLDIDSVVHINKTRLLQDIGVISLTRINIKHRNAYLGVYKNPLLHVSCGVLLLQAIEHIAFKEFALHMLYLEVKKDNIVAIRLYEKCGFEYMGLLKEAFFDKAQGYIDILVYAKSSEKCGL